MLHTSGDPRSSRSCPKCLVLQLPSLPWTIFSHPKQLRTLILKLCASMLPQHSDRWHSLVHVQSTKLDPLPKLSYLLYQTCLSPWVSEIGRFALVSSSSQAKNNTASPPALSHSISKVGSLLSVLATESDTSASYMESLCVVAGSSVTELTLCPSPMLLTPPQAFKYLFHLHTSEPDLQLQSSSIPPLQTSSMSYLLPTTY